jgi:hypothetical protein
MYRDDAAPLTTALYGDSHASHFFPGLGAVLSRHGENVVHLGDTGCPPLIGVVRTNERGGTPCTDINATIVPLLNARSTIRHVVLAFRVGGYTGEDTPATPPIKLAASGDTGEAAIERALTDTVASFLEHGKRVSLVLPVPGLGFELTECVGRPFAFHAQQVRTPCAVPYSEVQRQQRRFRDFVVTLQQRYALEVLDPVPLLCHGGACNAIDKGQPYYSDNNHLGMAGSMKVAAMFEP